MRQGFIKLRRRHREWLFGYLFIGLWIVGFLMFTLIPIAQSLYFSTKEVRISADGLQITGSPGWENYQLAFTYIYFVEALWDYIKQTLVTIPAIVVFSIIIGLLLNQSMRFRGLFRTIYFLPVIISSGPVLAKMRSQGAIEIPALTSAEWTGLIQGNLPELMSTTITALFAQVIVILWFTGVPVLIVIAGLQKIDRAIYESAAIDGASAWESFWKITLPAIRPLINIIIVFSIVSIAIFSSNEVMRIIDQRRLTQYGLSNAFAWIYFMVTLFLLSVLLLLANIQVSQVLHRHPRKRKKVKPHGS